MLQGLNLQVANVKAETQAPLNVYYKHFADDGKGNYVPTLIRNQNNVGAKAQFVEELKENPKLFIDISATMDKQTNKWFNICPRTIVDLEGGDIANSVDEIVKQTMSAVGKDPQKELYESISISLLVANRNETELAHANGDVLFGD